MPPFAPVRPIREKRKQKEKREAWAEREREAGGVHATLKCKTDKANPSTETDQQGRADKRWAAAQQQQAFHPTPPQYGEWLP